MSLGKSGGEVCSFQTMKAVSFLLRIPVLTAVAALCACGKVEDTPKTATAGAGSGNRPNVVLIVLDTLRADRLGSYGCERPTSPRLDAFAAESIRFSQAWAPSPFTASSHASLFASVYPATHGIWNKQLVDGKTEMGDLALSPAAVTLAEAMQQGGYATAAIADGGYLSTDRGLDQGFERFDSRMRGAPDRVDAALRWLEKDRATDRPFFLFLHTYEVHVPYMPDPADVARFASDYDGPMRRAYENALAFTARAQGTRKLQRVQEQFFRPVLQSADLTDEDRAFYIALYEAEVALADREIGRFLDQLAALGLAENTIVVLTADHGEEFWEHGQHGHYQVWRELLHVPMIVRIPGGPAGVVRNDFIDLVDLMPTLLSELGLPIPPTAVGLDIGFRAPRAAHSAAHRVVGEANYRYEQLACRADAEAAIFPTGPGVTDAAFNLALDPEERANLAASEEGAALLNRARAFLVEWRLAAERHRDQHGLAGVPVAGAGSASTQAELNQLGYTGDR